MRDGLSSPATLQFKQVSYRVSPTPDGAFLRPVAQAQESDLAATAYHWGQFGSCGSGGQNLRSDCEVPCADSRHIYSTDAS